MWDQLVGQRRAVASLQRAVAGDAMTHAWLFMGPPGSGRSNAAVAFAAALQCEQGGCGECHSCRTVLAGSHADVAVMRTAAMTFRVDDAREMVRKAALSPVGGGRQVIIVEDADRFNDSSGNAVLKALEEPNPRTVWMLCAPTSEDVLPTIRSRCRSVVLSTPTTEQIAAFLEQTHQVAPALAAYAARASQGHIGRAKAIALDDDTRQRRSEVVSLPATLTSLGAAMRAASQLAKVAAREAEQVTGELDARERRDLDAAFGVEARGRRPREYAPALKRLEDEQRRRAKRRVLDVVDRGLMDLVSVYRDAIALAVTGGFGAAAELVNAEIRADVETVAGASTPEANLRRVEAVFVAREQMLEFNVPVALALEAMMATLQLPERLELPEGMPR